MLLRSQEGPKAMMSLLLVVKMSQLHGFGMENHPIALIT